MDKKKGFSLVELLAVIVVLAIILVIAVPRLLVTIDETDKKAFTSDLNELIGTSKLEHNEKLSGVSKDVWYYFEDGKQTNFDISGQLHFNGNVPLKGYILVTKDGKVELELTSHNGKFCASKELEDKNATIEKCEVKEQEPFKLELRTTNTTNSIRVDVVNPTDLTIFYYKIKQNETDKAEFESSDKNYKVYNNLKENKTYYITVKGCRKKEVVCDEKTVEVTLPNLNNPTFTIKSIPTNQTESQGWATSREVTINYTQDDEILEKYKELKKQYLFASTVDEVIKKVYDNEWTDCEFESCTLKPAFTSDTFVIARITDGVNELGKTVQKLTNFDTEKPTAPEITGGSANWINSSRTISVSTPSKAKSGIKKYQYYVSTSSTELKGGEWKDCETSKTSQIFKNFGTYYIFFRAISYVDLISNPSTYQIVKVDNKKPSIPTSEIRYDSSTGTIRANSSSWTNKTLWWGNYNATDEGSGIDYYEYSEGCTGTKTGNLSGESVFGNNWNKTYCIQSVDKVGNKSGWSSTYYFKIDMVSPTVTIAGKKASAGTTVSSGAWSNEGLNFTLTKTSSGSSGYTIYYCKDTANTCTPTTIATSGTAITGYNTLTGTYYIRYYIKGGSGISSTVSSYTAKVDKTTPTVSYNLAGGYYNTTKTVRVTGVDSNFNYMKVHVYKNGTKLVENNSITSKTFDVSLDSEGSWTVYAKVYDKAGNKQSVSPENSNGWYYQTYVIDTTLPTVSYNLSGGTYNAKKTVTVTGSDTNFNYMNVHVYKNGTFVSGKSVSSRTSNTFSVSLDSDGSWTVYAQVYDKAGNKHNKSPDNGGGWYYQNYLIDTTPPTCVSSGGSTAWTSSGRTLVGTCSDSGSGCTGNVSWLINWQGNWTNLSPGTVYDKAGNSTSCPADQTVRVGQYANISYTVYLQDNKTMSAQNGVIGGTVGLSKAAQRIAISASTDGTISGNINYSAHIQGTGDVLNYKNGAVIGTSGKRLEKIKIWLDGDLKDAFDLYYRVHVQTQGWLKTVSNGAWTGSSGLCKRIEAIQIKAVPKGSGVPSFDNSGQNTTTNAAELDSSNGSNNCEATCKEQTCKYYYPCTRYKGGGNASSCASEGGYSTATSNCGSAFYFCCAIPGGATCEGEEKCCK